MTIILGIIKLLGSAGFGTIFGGLMGLLNRKADLAAKRADQAHDIAMRKADAEIMAQEWAARTKVAQVEGEAKVEAEAYAALGKSYEFAQPDKGSKMAAFSTFVRPFISLGYFIITSLGGGYIIYYAFQVAQIKLTTEQLFELTMFVISWIAFMGGATIGWWFAMRPGKQPPALSLR